MSIGGSSAVEAHNGSAVSYAGAGAEYFGAGIMGYGTTTVPVGSGEELTLVKVDYDMPPSATGNTYGGGWPGESASNPGFFTMWNDLSSSSS